MLQEPDRFAPGRKGETEAMDHTDLCVIFNPKAGRGRAARRLARLRRQWGRRMELRPTEGPGHGEDLGLQAAKEGFGIVAAAGGDGTVHEVANGLLRAGRPEVAFSVVPLGSANDYAHSLGIRESQGLVAGPTGGDRRVDVGVVDDAGSRKRYFVNSLGLGLNGAVTLESRRIHRLQGLALYGLATLRALWYHYACPVMTFHIDGAEWRAPTLLMSVGIGRREGGFVLAPQAQVDDGLFEFLHAGKLSRWEVLRFLPRVALAGPPTDHPKVRIGQCRTLVVQSETPLTVHLDGEFFSRPEDAIRAIHIRILPGALRVRGLIGAEEESVSGV
jgi:diacylglycerol kinase family enzyme